jgi:two-component system chemotaxis response regulator CheB
LTPYRVLVVDDSAFMRKIITDLIVQDPKFTIVATAVNGQEALEKIQEFKPDAVTLDLEMPVMNGIEALRHIMKATPTPVIMLSGISEENTRETIKALQLGAFDFIRKPSGIASNDIHQVGEVLLEKLRIAVLTKRYQPVITIDEQPEKQQEKRQHAATTPVKPAMRPDKQIKPLRAASPLHKKEQDSIIPGSTAKAAAPPAPLPGIRKPVASSPPPASAAGSKLDDAKDKTGGKPAGTGTFRHLVAIGTSTGGPRALHEVITSLPGDFPAPVLIVQHMPPKFTKSLAQRLDSFSALKVIEAEQGNKVTAGVVYLAPGGYHMELVKELGGYAIKLTEQPQRNGHRPSVDVMFESLLPFNELKRHAVIMTGMGSDGAKGMKLLAEAGVESTIAETEETCVVYGMPRSAVEMGCVSKVLPLQHIAGQLTNAVQK